MLVSPRISFSQLRRRAVHTPWLFVLIYVGNALFADERAVPAPVPSFKVENRVYRGEDRFLCRSLTLVLGTKAYDFLDDPAEVMVLDFAGRRLTVLSPERNEQMEMSFQAVMLFLERLRDRAAHHPDPSVRFAADPQFDVAYDEAAATYSFSGPWMSYRIRTTSAVDPAICRKFWEVSSWLCRVNTLLTPGSHSPLARLVVNSELAEKGVFPVEVRYYGGPRNFLEWLPGRRLALRTTHQLILEIEPADRERVQQVEDWLRTFPRVNLTDYQSRR